MSALFNTMDIDKEEITVVVSEGPEAACVNEQAGHTKNNVSSVSYSMCITFLSRPCCLHSHMLFLLTALRFPIFIGFGYTSMVWVILRWFGLYCDGFHYTPMVWVILRWFGLYSDGLGYTPMVWVILRWFGLYSDGLGYTPMVWVILRWFGLYSDGLGYTPMNFNLTLGPTYLETHKPP